MEQHRKLQGTSYRALGAETDLFGNLTLCTRTEHTFTERMWLAGPHHKKYNQKGSNAREYALVGLGFTYAESCLIQVLANQTTS